MKKNHFISCSRIISFGCLLVYTFFFNSCKKENSEASPPPTPEPNPVACFTIPSGHLINSSDIIEFKTCSKEFDRVYWTFGDGQSSSLNEPTHKWPSNGQFKVSLTTYKGTKSATTEQNVFVGLKAHTNFIVTFSNWNLPLNFYGVSIRIKICRSSDINSYYNGGSRSVVYGSSPPLIEGLPVRLGDDLSTYKIKMILGNGSNSESSLDSVITDEIDVFKGPNMAVASKTLSFVNITYTITPIQIY